MSLMPAFFDRHPSPRKYVCIFWGLLCLCSRRRSLTDGDRIITNSQPPDQKEMKNLVQENAPKTLDHGSSATHSHVLALGISARKALDLHP
jgi:hypothetical protein